MKKFILLLLALVLCLSACKGGGEEITYLTYSSDNGYTVNYPDTYTISHLSPSMDFVIMDDDSGSSVTILSKEKQRNVLNASTREVLDELEGEGYLDVSVDYIEEQEINGTPCLVIRGEAKGSSFVRVIYDASDNTYIATFTCLSGALDSVERELEAVAMGLFV